MGDLPGDIDLLVRRVGVDGGDKMGALAVAEALRAGPQDGPDPIEGVGFRPRQPRVSCWARRRTSSIAAVPSFRM